MKKEIEEKAVEIFAETIISRLETIQSDWKKPWISSVSFPQNVDKRPYNGMNALMLSFLVDSKKYRYPVFGTYNKWDAFNYDSKGKKVTDEFGKVLPHVGVKKGEKSFPVMYYMPVVMKDGKKISLKEYDAMTDSEKDSCQTFPSMQIYNVFNISQTDIEEKRPELFKKLTSDFQGHAENIEGFDFPAMDYMISENKWVCQINEVYGDDSYYSISKDTIVLPERTQFPSQEKFYSTCFHEMAHSTGAEKRLNRLSHGGFGSNSYAREELVAELTAAITASRYGMQKCVKEDSVPYLKAWLDNLKEDPSYIKTVLNDVRKAHNTIVSYIEACKNITEKKAA